MKRPSVLWCCCAVLLLSACKEDDGSGGIPDSGNPDAGGIITPTIMTVSGKVVGPDLKPFPNATVLILGKQPVTSDASGAFSISGVTTPYDIVAVNPGIGFPTVYQGLTRQDLTLQVPSGKASPSFNATLTGSVIGAQTPSATVSEPKVVFTSRNGVSSQSQFSADSSTYSLPVSWGTSATTTGTLFAFQGERAASTDSVYTRFTGFGRRDNVSISSAATVSNQHVTLGSVGNSTLGGTITVPSGMTVTTKSVDLRLAPDQLLSLVDHQDSSATFSYAVPVVAQSTFEMDASAVTADSKASSFVRKPGLAAGTNNVSLVLKAPPSLVLPLDNATDVTRASEFTWNGTPGSVYSVIFIGAPSSAGTPYGLIVVTSATRITLPDLSALGIALPANTTMTWNITMVGPLNSTDAWFDDPVFLLDENYYGFAGSRRFTTASTP